MSVTLLIEYILVKKTFNDIIKNQLQTSSENANKVKSISQKEILLFVSITNIF